MRLAFRYASLQFPYLVWIHAAGRADQRGLLQSATRKDYQRYILYVGEQSLRQMAINSQNLGRAVTQQCAIVDMEGLTMRQLTYKPGKMFNFS